MVNAANSGKLDLLGELPIEAQIFGGVTLARDVAIILVAPDVDPAVKQRASTFAATNNLLYQEVEADTASHAISMPRDALEGVRKQLLPQGDRASAGAAPAGLDRLVVDIKTLGAMDLANPTDLATAQRILGNIRAAIPVQRAAIDGAEQQARRMARTEKANALKQVKQSRNTMAALDKELAKLVQALSTALGHAA